MPKVTPSMHIGAGTRTGPKSQVSAVLGPLLSLVREACFSLPFICSQGPRFCRGQEERYGQLSSFPWWPTGLTGSQGQGKAGSGAKGDRGPGGKCELRGPRPEHCSHPTTSTIAAGAPRCLKTLIRWPKAVQEPARFCIRKEREDWIIKSSASEGKEPWGPSSLVVLKVGSWSSTSSITQILNNKASPSPSSTLGVGPSNLALNKPPRRV